MACGKSLKFLAHAHFPIEFIHQVFASLRQQSSQNQTTKPSISTGRTFLRQILAFISPLFSLLVIIFLNNNAV